MASPSPARIPPFAKLIASGFRNLECPRMYASGFPGFSAEPARLSAATVFSWHFWAGATMLAAQQIENCAPVLRAWGPDIAVEVAGEKFVSAFVRAVES